MVDPEKNILAFLRSNPASVYYVACSGGVDSMLLLNIIHNLGFKVAAVHVNYQLRGEDSEKDQEIVETTCKELNIPAHIKKVDLKKYLKENSGNLQEIARTIRYSYLESFLFDAQAKIVLAHHADDQIETFFMNVLRGSGMMGLSCMLPVNNNYLRPLLPFTKNEIRELARIKKIKWREDVSNSSDKYQRNKLRNLVLPELQKQLPELKNNVLFMIQVFQENQKEIELKLQPISKSVELIRELSFEQFDSLNEFELMELLRQLAIPLSMHEEFTKLRKSNKGKHVKISSIKFISVIHEGDHFFFKEPDDSKPLPEIHSELILNLPASFIKTELYIPVKKIEGELKVRRWEKGDKMKPLGLSGSKLISDILTDSKVPNHLREQQLVLTDETKILWCVGFAISEFCRPDDSDIEDGILKISLILPDEHSIPTIV